MTDELRGYVYRLLLPVATLRRPVTRLYFFTAIICTKSLKKYAKVKNFHALFRMIYQTNDLYVLTRNHVIPRGKVNRVKLGQCLRLSYLNSSSSQ